MAVEQVVADFPKNPPTIRERVLTDADFELLLRNADAYLEKTAKPKLTLQQKILQDPDFYLLLQNADKFLATPEPPTAPIQVLEPTTVMPVVTEPVAPAPPIENIQTIQTRLSALKTRLSKVPVSDTAMWQRLSSQISLLVNQEAQMLKKVAKNAALSARWHWEGVKDFVPDISHKKDALTAAGVGAVALAGAAAYSPISTRAAQAFSATRAAITQPGVLPAYGITEATSPQEVRNILPATIVDQAPLIKFATVDSNSPTHWDGNTMYVFNSTKTGIKRLSGPDLAHLREETPVSFDNKINGARWMEATYKDPTTGVLYGWYHNEPEDPSLPKRPQPLTVPRIGAAVSKDNGQTWHDLGFVIDTPQNSINPDTVNLFFAGGNGDFSVIPDPNKEYFYFFISNYDKDPNQQGVAVARIKRADLASPTGQVFKWHNGKWQEPGEGGRVTPIFKANGDVHKPETDFFWGPSVHWNNYLKQYIMLLNYSKNAAFEQGGIYISFNQDLSNPEGWTPPQKIKDAESSTSWYPQIVGLNGGTDREAGRLARLFETGKSNLVIEFVKPGEENNIRTYGNLLTTKPTFFRPGTNEQINPLVGERQIEVLRPAGRGRFLVQTSTGQLEIPMEQVDVQGKLSWEKEIKPLEWLGFDTVVPKLIDRIPEIGAGLVRIPVEKADKPFFDKHPWVVESIKRAREKNLEILLLFNPTELLDEAETRQRIDDILSLVNGYDKVLFELGNEPDLWPFWENQDLHTYAQFVNMASKILWQRKPDARIVVAAASQEKAIQPLVNILKTYGIDTNKFIFSLHAYQHENDVAKRVKLLKQVIGDDGKFLFDEIGVNTSDKDKAEHVPKMIAEARQNGSLYVIIFQLWNVPFAAGADRGLWGFVDYDGRFELPAWSLVNYAWGETHQ